jgi:hypothetical protein
MLAFKGVLMDIPGKPTGVFVSQAGYQKGALEVARSSGITAFELRQVYQKDVPGMSLTTTSIGIVIPRPDIMALELTVLRPDVTDLIFTLDKNWNEQHHVEFPLTPNLSHVFGSNFVDDCGNERTSLHKLVQDLARGFRDGGRTELSVEFRDPTYVTGMEVVSSSGVLVDKLKIMRVTATINIIKTTTIVPILSPATVTYLFKNALENNL